MHHEQVEVYSQGSTHTIHETCGFSNCREIVLENLGVGDERYSDETKFHVTFEGRAFSDGPVTEIPATLTVNPLDDSDDCVWCYGCGNFLRHANASYEPDGKPSGCECEERGHDPEEDREAMKPMVLETGRLELRPF